MKAYQLFLILFFCSAFVAAPWLIDTNAAKESTLSIVKWARMIVFLPTHRAVMIGETKYHWKHYRDSDYLILERSLDGKSVGNVSSINDTEWRGYAHGTPSGEGFYLSFPTLQEATQHVEALVAKYPKPTREKSKEDAARFISGD